jgi:hypothetical protein
VTMRVVTMNYRASLEWCDQYVSLLLQTTTGLTNLFLCNALAEESQSIKL